MGQRIYRHLSIRYAHLSSSHLQNAASRICVTNLLHAVNTELTAFYLKHGILITNISAYNFTS